MLCIFIIYGDNSLMGDNSRVSACVFIARASGVIRFLKSCLKSMESQMVQNPRGKIVFTFNKFFIKVKTDFHQAHQNQVTSNKFVIKVKKDFPQAR